MSIVRQSKQERNLATGQDAVDVQAFQRFYEDNLHVIYRYIYSKVGNREEAEDLTSQIFMKAVRMLSRERAADNANWQRWLFQVARTTLADYWRSHYRLPLDSLEELLDAGWQGPSEEISLSCPDDRPAERVQRILQALPAHYREVLICRFLLNLSIKETALRMGLSEANVKVLQFRALKRAAELESVVTG